MPKVEIEKKRIRVGGKEIPLISGEVHYWRLNPNYWKDSLARVREMGLTIVSTYVPWDFHEYKRGQFDFTGKTDDARDLKSFLELTRKEGFWLIIRPGPYIYSEWPHDGVPDYAYKYHRLHPKFLGFASAYLKEVTKVFKPYLATRNKGHIILLQADNEIDPWPDVFGQQYGLSGEAGLFQDFIQKLYADDLEALNRAWGTAYGSFREASPFIATMLAGEQGIPLKGDKELKRNLDYFKFKYDYALKAARWNVRAYRDLGINIPIYLNTYPFFYAHDWAEFQSAADMVGVDLYPTNELAEDEFEHRKFCDKIRYLASVSKMPFIAEFQSGVWHGRHYETSVLTPNHYRMICFSALLAGVKGWNWYMLVNRDNWYMSPINEWGRVRGELYDVFKQIVRAFKLLNPSSLEKLTEVAVTFNPLQYAARTLTHNSPILRALYQGDVDYDVCDPRRGVPQKKVVFYSGNQWLDMTAHKNLRKYVERGGTLVAFRSYPRKDENFNPYQEIGLEDPERILFEFKRQFAVTLDKDRPAIPINSSVYVFKAEGCRKIRANMGGFGDQTVGYIKTVGKGKIIHLGFEPTPEIVVEVLECLGVPLFAYSTTRDVKTAIFRRGSKYYLVAVNNGKEDKTATVHLPVLEKNRAGMVARDLVSGEKFDQSRERRRIFSFSINRKDGRIFELSA
ncbi:MAG: Beta-galactosidase precursor [Candidatus Omnitrophica bacterium ADurb.Bin277]|nr:MAG: Beta-galactosidase precursor [Candidatus Omnitrophica bacterium ADurb.Bin277]